MGRGVWVGDEYIDHFCILPRYGIGIKVGETAEVSIVNIPAGYDESDIEWSYATDRLTFDGKKLTGVAPGKAWLAARVLDDDHCEIEWCEITVAVYTLSGSCSADEVHSDLVWKMDPDAGVLTISGQGEMPDYVSAYSEWVGDISDAPWFPAFLGLGLNNSHLDVDVVVEDGVSGAHHRSR